MANKNIIEKVEVSPEVESVAPAEKSPTIEAVVYNGKYEVRRYNLTNHGAGFSELAEDFASKKGYTVKYEEAKQGVKCPSCGHVFDPAKHTV